MAMSGASLTIKNDGREEVSGKAMVEKEGGRGNKTNV